MQGVVTGQVPGAGALASVEEFKEPLEEGPQQVKLATPLAEKISVACPTLPDPHPQPARPRNQCIAGPSIRWGWASNGAEASI